MMAVGWMVFVPCLYERLFDSIRNEVVVVVDDDDGRARWAGLGACVYMCRGRVPQLGVCWGCMGVGVCVGDAWAHWRWWW